MHIVMKNYFSQTHKVYLRPVLLQNTYQTVPILHQHKVTQSALI